MWVYLLAFTATAAAYYYVRAGKRRKLLESSLSGKTIVVTGGGSGIGATLVERLAVREKADVYVWDINSEGMQAVKARVEHQGGQCAIFPVDVSNSSQVSEIVKLMESKGKEIDVLVNNAGVAVCKPYLETTDAESEKTFRVNVFGILYAVRVCLGSMLRRNRGHIVNVSSVMDSLATTNMAAYCSSKWAVTGFTESLREELAAQESSIAITLVRPWLVGTPMFAGIKFWNHYARRIFPPTTTDAVAEAIIRGIKCKDEVVTVPPHIALLCVVFHLLPPSVRIFVQKHLSLNTMV